VVDNVYHNYFQPACKALGLGAVRFHDLRHTFATLALSAGEHYMQVSKWLGHSSYVLTLTNLRGLHQRGRHRRTQVRPPGGTDTQKRSAARPEGPLAAVRSVLEQNTVSESDTAFGKGCPRPGTRKHAQQRWECSKEQRCAHVLCGDQQCCSEADQHC
jgi:hypothetical protein